MNIVLDVAHCLGCISYTDSISKLFPSSDIKGIRYPSRCGLLGGRSLNHWTMEEVLSMHVSNIPCAVDHVQHSVLTINIVFSHVS
jgi:hypothetical protein